MAEKAVRKYCKIATSKDTVIIKTTRCGGDLSYKRGEFSKIVAIVLKGRCKVKKPKLPKNCDFKPDVIQATMQWYEDKAFIRKNRRSVDAYKVIIIGGFCENPEKEPEVFVKGTPENILKYENAIRNNEGLPHMIDVLSYVNMNFLDYSDTIYSAHCDKIKKINSKVK